MIALITYVICGGLLVGIGKGLRHEPSVQTGSDMIGAMLWPLICAIAVGHVIGTWGGKKPRAGGRGA